MVVRTLQSPTSAATVYVTLSSVCTSTGAVARCGGSFAVHPGMALSLKCESIVQTVTANCAANGYAVSRDDCASTASFTASNVGCPRTPFALGVSNDPGVFDQSESGSLPDGEVELICAPPGAVGNLRLQKLDGGATLGFVWDDIMNAESYLIFEDQTPGGGFATVAGTAASGTTGLSLSMPPGTEFFLVAGSNANCGVGPKH